MPTPHVMSNRFISAWFKEVLTRLSEMQKYINIIKMRREVATNEEHLEIPFESVDDLLSFVDELEEKKRVLFSVILCSNSC